MIGYSYNMQYQKSQVKLCLPGVVFCPKATVSFLFDEYRDVNNNRISAAAAILIDSWQRVPVNTYPSTAFKSICPKKRFTGLAVLRGLAIANKNLYNLSHPINLLFYASIM